MSFEKDIEQENVLDGTIYLIDERHGDGAYVTVAGRGGHPFILAFGLDDLEYLAEVARNVKGNTT
ncbi:hypothetical protein [Rhodococcus jostii]|uniref:hypothetical protein n=1 Tax=Rhodococcus jostii TaxID=132919 RepID=UPI00363B4599